MGICSLGSVVSDQTTDDVMSPEYWLVSTGGSSYTFSSDVYISDCNANGAFTGLECLENNVYDSADTADETFGGILQELLDEHMAVSSGACTVGAGAEDTSSSTGTVIAVVVVLLVLLLCVVGCFVWWKMNKVEGDVSFGATSVATGTGAEEAEPDTEVGTMGGQ